MADPWTWQRFEDGREYMGNGWDSHPWSVYYRRKDKKFYIYDDLTAVPGNPHCNRDRFSMRRVKAGPFDTRIEAKVYYSLQVIGLGNKG